MLIIPNLLILAWFVSFAITGACESIKFLVDKLELVLIIPELLYFCFDLLLSRLLYL